MSAVPSRYDWEDITDGMSDRRATKCSSNIARYAGMRAKSPKSMRRPPATMFVAQPAWD
jgi:hypothetical protein